MLQGRSWCDRQHASYLAGHPRGDPGCQRPFHASHSPEDLDRTLRVYLPTQSLCGICKGLQQIPCNSLLFLENAIF